MHNSNDERDSFWDLSRLVPKKKEYIPPFNSKSIVSDYEIRGEESRPSKEGMLNFKPGESSASFEERSYVPGHHNLIKRVSVKKIVDKYDFYDSFRKSAELYYECKADKCDFVSFYSYMPQYSQLTREQKNYYFYWRDSVRHGRFIKSDYSYVYLLVYEILNLPEKICPKEGIELLCKLWREYRGTLRRIDSYFAVWVQDYCLIYDLECPMDIIGDFIFDVIEASSFKEFYLSNAEQATTRGVDSMVAYLSDYDWRRGKFVEGAHSELYKKHMRGAMGKIICDVFSNGIGVGDDVATITRDAFPHSLCTHAVKCKLVLEYYPMSRDMELRSIFTGCVRYTENKLRGLIGVKSRLAVKDLEEKYKQIIDKYFNDLVSSVEKKRAVKFAPEYEKLYDAPSEVFSSEGADEIEKVSWSTTLRLVAESEENEICEEKTEQKVEVAGLVEENASADDTRFFGLSSEDVERIGTALAEGFSDDAAAERINEAFADGFGDIILELQGELYVVIDDYKEEIEEWLRQTK